MTQTELAVTSTPTSKWKSYPEYKNSGVEWLGEIPKHWEVKRSDNFLQEKREGVDPKTIDGHTVFHYSIPIIEETGNGKLENGSDIDSNKLLLKGGELLISKLNPRKSRILVTEWHSELTLCSSEFVVLQSKNCNVKFAFYLYSSEGVRQYLSAQVESATRSHQRVSVDAIAKMWSGWPPLPEQHAIATFLDHQTSKINELIAKKERHIELLQEKRTALISHAVTKGLDSHVPMKDSGVEWLGEIPKHWEVKRLKYVASFYGGGTPSKENIEYWSGNIPWVSPKDMKTEIIADAEDHITKNALENSSTRLIQPGAILVVVRSGILRHSIPVAMNVRPVAINQDMKAIVTQGFLMPEYFASVIRGHQKALLVEWRKEGATVESIEYELLVNTPCPIPPLDEQHAITAYIDLQTAKIDVLISKIREAVEKLQEYRTALISAAVTGKIDVRGEIAAESAGMSNQEANSS